MAKPRINPDRAAKMPHVFGPPRAPLVPARADWPPGFARWIVGVMVQRYYIAPLGPEEGWIRLVTDLARRDHRTMTEQDALDLMLAQFAAAQPPVPPLPQELPCVPTSSSDWPSSP